MRKLSSGKNQEQGSPITSIGLVPITIAEALALVSEAAEDQSAQTASDRALLRTQLRDVASKLDSVLLFMFGSDCNLAALKLTDGQREYLRYVLDQFAKGKEIEIAHTKPTVVSIV